MRVLNCFLDNRFGGPQKRACEVASRLKSRGVETLFLLNEKSKTSKPVHGFVVYSIKHAQILSVEKSLLELLRFLFFVPINIQKTLSIIKKEEIDIVHVNGLVNLLPAVAAKMLHTKVIWHLNDTSTPRAIKAFFLPFVRLCSNAVAIAARQVGRYCFRRNEGLWKKADILYPPVDMEAFNPERIDRKKIHRLKEEFGASEQDLLIGTVGNINPAKGYEYFIQAAQRIASKANNVKFVIVGTELETQKPYSRKIRNLIKHYNLQDKFVLAGFREEIPEILCLFDVFVLASVSEACPIVVLEAMAMKVPIVATNVGGVPEQVMDGQTGHVVEPRNPAAIATAVLALLQTPKAQLEEMVEKGRRRAERIFSLDRIAGQHRQLYQRLVTGN